MVFDVIGCCVFDLLFEIVSVMFNLSRLFDRFVIVQLSVVSNVLSVRVVWLFRCWVRCLVDNCSVVIVLVQMLCRIVSVVKLSLNFDCYMGSNVQIMFVQLLCIVCVMQDSYSMCCWDGVVFDMMGGEKIGRCIVVCFV